jgi:MoaA/NifB/PqqE/SkfB family radical SAM enzyme
MERQMEEVQYIDPQHDGPMMSWVMNQRCNFTCEYCFYTKEYLAVENPKVGKYSPQHIAEKFNKTGQEWYIYLNGGEPFLYPKFNELCEELTQKHYISINSNISTSNCIDFADRIDPKKVYSIEASLHIEEREQRNGLKRYLKNFLNFQEKGFPIQVVYVTYPDLFDRIEDDIHMLKSEGIKIINLKVFRGYYKLKYYPQSYTEHQREIIEKHALDKNEINILEESLSYFGKKCGAGYDFFLMDPEGDVRRCSSSAKSYGNFFEGTFKIDKQARACPFLQCSCPYEGMNRTSAEKDNIFKISQEIIREGTPYIYKKARPVKIYRYLKKRYKTGN